jgi:hypothetical protein
VSVSYVIRNGRRIEVETLPDLPGTAAKTHKRAKKAEQAFAQIPVWWAARACSGGGYGPHMLVCVELIHRSWKAGGKPFKMPKSLSENIRRDYKVFGA